MTQLRPLPQLPPIGKPDWYYGKHIHHADRVGDALEREAHKVAQYITLAISPVLCWKEKLKYFDHAIRRHCCPPPLPDEVSWLYYHQLMDLIRQHAGEEALRLASAADDQYASRLERGEDRESIGADAETFFRPIVGFGHERPNHFNDDDWQQLRLIRDQWV